MTDILQLYGDNTLYFLSDAHFGAPLGVKEEIKQQYFYDFGGSIAAGQNHLFILGDLFDFWFEWRKVIPKRCFRVLYHLAQWRERGLQMYYLAGNHDFRLGGFLEQEVGVHTYINTLDFSAGGKRFHLFHGDGVQKSDSGYRILKKVFRNRINQAFFLAFHPDWGIALADWSSSKSRESNLLKNPSKAENDYIEYAERKIAGGADYVLMGHTHRPLLHRFERGCYINTGNWYRAFSYAKFENGELTLNYYNP